MTKSPKKILLVDDHSLIREGIKSSIVSHNGDYEVIEASNVKDALKIYEDQNLSAIVMDISLPDGNGMDLAQQILEENSQQKIIMLSMYNDYDYISRCLEIGVNGYVLKNEGHEIVEGLNDIFEGRNYYSTGVRDIIVNQYAQKAKKKTEAPEPISLTQREKEVLKYVVDGHTSNEIADKLFISTRTVDTHRSNIMKKLDVKNSISLINKVKDLNLLQ